MTTSVNEVIFFILLGVFYIIFFLATNYFYIGSNTKKTTMLIISAIVFSLFFVGYSQITGVCKNEGFQSENSKNSKNRRNCGSCGLGGSQMSSCPSPGAKLCRGGPYMWNGDSERSKFCRNLASTEQGNQEIQSFECGAGYTGMPGGGFRFTPISGDDWCNKRCDTPSGCDINSNGIFGN